MIHEAVKYIYLAIKFDSACWLGTDLLYYPVRYLLTNTYVSRANRLFE